MAKPSLRIIHCLPGRMRLHLAPSLQNFVDFEHSVRGHEGILSLSYTTISNSLLVCFEPDKVTQQELILRIALTLSLAYQLTPVRISMGPKVHKLSDGAAYSGMLLGIALLTRLGKWNNESRSLFDWIAALGVTGATFDHAWQELQSEGNFHPETLSVMYLIAAIAKGNLLPASLFTWVTSFGRHLASPPPMDVELRAFELPGNTSQDRSYEVVISRLPGSSYDKTTIFRLLPSLVIDAFGWSKSWKPPSMLDQLRELSKNHGAVLEGLGERPQGITMRIR